jgi:hypothetical protein
MSLIKLDDPNMERIAERLRNFAGRGQYKQGADLAEIALKKYPNNFYFTYQHAKLIGDWADDLPHPRQRKIKSKASKILKTLTRRLAGQSVRIRFGVCLNYYYQSNAFMKMYKYGKRFEASERKQGLYAQSLGASLLAEEMFFSNSKIQSEKWANRSILLWRKYGLKSERYYFPFYCLAMSLLIIGNPQKALVNLKIAARLSQRSIKCVEFKSLYKLIQKDLK